MAHNRAHNDTWKLFYMRLDLPVGSRVGRRVGRVVGLLDGRTIGTQDKTQASQPSLSAVLFSGL